MGSSNSTQNNNIDFLEFKDRIFNWVPEQNIDNSKEEKYERFNSKFPNSYICINHEPYCGPVFNQGKLGSCTANAIAGAYIYKYNLEHNIKPEINKLENQDNDEKHDLEFIPSRLFIYYNERNMEHTTTSDSGAKICDGIKSLETIGTCSEDLWPYNIEEFKDKPPEESYTTAKDHMCIKSHRVFKSIENLKACIDQGNVIVFGFTVFNSFKNGKLWNCCNVMPMPEEDDELLGGHAVLMIGYDDDLDCFIIRNSWGSDWRNHGDFYMPYDFVIGEFDIQTKYLGQTWWDRLETRLLKLEESKLSTCDNCDNCNNCNNKDSKFVQPYCSDFWVIDTTKDL